MTIETPDPSELDTLNNSLEALTKKMAEYEATLKPLQIEKELLSAEANAAYQVYLQAKAKSDTRAREISEELFDKQRELRKLRQEQESLQRQAAQLAKLQAVSREFANLEANWDRLTAGAPWREWAKDHQIEAAQKITYFRKLILADTMGLGKTLSSIIAMDMIKAATNDATQEFPYAWSEKTNEFGYTYIDHGVPKPCGRKILYFCPATMLRNVQKELRRWAPHRTALVIGSLPKASRKMAIELMLEHPEYVIICNYEAWRKDMSLIQDLISIEFDTVIIDEAHNIKDRNSVAYRGINRIISESNVPFVIPMTGTPILNRPQELYSLLTLVAPDEFPYESQYLRDYCDQDPYTGKWSFKIGGLERLAKRISNRYLRRTKEQAGIQLPPRTIVEHEIEVDEITYAEQARARNEMRKWGSIMLDPDAGTAITAMAQIAVYTRLRQIETWPAGIEVKGPDGEVAIRLNIEQSQKLDEVIHYDHETQEWEGIIPEVVTDERVVVFSQFTKPLFELERRCKAAGISVAVLTGDTNDKMREEILDDFDARNETDKYRVVLAHYKVGGVGANFTAATQMVILDEEWNPGKREQAYDRIHRIGQTKPTTIHVLRDKNTIDEWLAGIIDEKEEIVDGFHRSADSMAEEAWRALREGRM